MGLDKFSAALDFLKGFNVNLYVGEDIFKGKLIGVEADHVVLETENKYIFYYNIDKIHAITKNTKQFQPETSTADFQKTQSLSDLLHSFHHSWVTILSINKQQFCGVLSEIDTDFATLINGEERILIKLIHISNILKGFIKEETKKESAKEKAENQTEAKNNENEAKEEVSVSCQATENKTENKKENKERQTTKATGVTAEKKEKAQKNREESEMTEKPQEVVAVAEVIEPNNTMGWSLPIKVEAPVIQAVDETPITTNKKQQTTSETTHKVKTEAKKTTNEMKKPNNEINLKEKQNEEPSMSKPKPVEPVKEMKPVKEATIKIETKPAAKLPAPAPKKEEKPVKSQETTTASKPVKSQQKTTASKPVKSQETTTTSKPVLSQNAAPNKTENTISEKFVNDTKNVWKQKDQEKKAFRFAGEPVSRDTERAFPFAGWPSKNKRTFRF
ncbi:spore coat protein B [Neobacillus bataviensis LMG 21833]|uniref:Spore coat protein B n=1 Tax=Neobacillus bataviensis LMG 21833 TaxID=1117379 RepID=K6DPF7_9BACI|nr:hypothetical protein [Neobacillus bataviensis]EKN70053.1 spore coat protein B [Neobacillus bataviensis LMG 21833]